MRIKEFLRFTNYVLCSSGNLRRMWWINYKIELL